MAKEQDPIEKVPFSDKDYSGILGEAGPQDVGMPGTATVLHGFPGLHAAYISTKAFLADRKGRGTKMEEHAKLAGNDIVAEQYNRTIRILVGPDMAKVRRAVEIGALTAGVIATAVVIYKHTQKPGATGSSEGKK